MYSPRVIAAKEVVANRWFKSRFGADLVRHSIEQVAYANEQIEKLMLDGLLPSHLPAEITKHIANERTLCRIDFHYFSTRYCWIKSFDNRLIRFKPNIAQQIFLSLLGEMEDEGKELMFQFLKARRLGVSTISQLCIQHRLQFFTNLQAIAGSDNPEDSDKLTKMLFFSFERQPKWLRPMSGYFGDPVVPPIGRYKTGLFYEFDNGNRLDLEHGSQVSDIGRGENPTVGHLCLSAHSIVLTQDGQLKPISEMRAGDSVVTSSGMLAKVKACVKSRRTNEMTSEIAVWGTWQPLSCTRDHPVLSQRGWLPAHEVQNGDSLIVPVRPITHTKTGFSLTLEKRSKYKNRPLDFAYNFETGWLFGLYLAEGSIAYSLNARKVKKARSVYFSMHEKEVDKFREGILKVAGLEQRLPHMKRQNSKTALLQLTYTALAAWIDENFGAKDTKRIPDWAWEAGENFCKGLVKGYLDGDGHIPPHKQEIFATSVRAQLPIQLRGLVASLGYGWSDIYFKPSGYYYGRNCQNAWTWHCSSSVSRKLREAMEWPAVDASERDNTHWRYLASDKIAVDVSDVGDGYGQDFYDLEIDAPEHDFYALQGIVHNSELAKMINAVSLIDAGLMRAIIPSPSVFWVFEGTADGDDNWWAKKYRYNKANYGKTGGSARMRPTFLPWFVGRDIYPAPMWLSTNEWERVKGQWLPKESTVKHAHKAKDYVAANPLLRKHLGDEWEMPLEQMYFYECSIKEYKENGILYKWLQEMAGDDEEAFQSRAFSIYDAELRMDIRNSLENPKAVYMLRGRDIPQKLHPTNRDINKKPALGIRASWSHSLPPFDFEFVPIKFTGYSETDPNNKLFIWEGPKDGEVYYIAIDTSDGLGVDRSDNTVIQVLRKGDRFRNDAQVAEFASPDLSGSDLWPWVLAIGTYYSTHHNGKLTQPQLVGETNREGGREVLKQMSNRGWANFYYHMRGKTPEIGIHVTRINRQGDDSIIQNFNQAVNNGYLKINSYWLCGELDAFVKHANGKISAADGRKDDRIFAAAECFFTMYDWELRSSQTTPFIDRARELPPQEKYPLLVNPATSSNVPFSRPTSVEEEWH